jgi:hypothetical protein
MERNRSNANIFSKAETEIVLGQALLRDALKAGGGSVQATRREAVQHRRTLRRAASNTLGPSPNCDTAFCRFLPSRQNHLYFNHRAFTRRGVYIPPLGKYLWERKQQLCSIFCQLSATNDHEARPLGSTPR